MNNCVITRYGEPSKFDYASQGTICKVIRSNLSDEFDIYIQLNTNEEDPDWNLIGTFKNIEDDFIKQKIKEFNQKIEII